MHYAELSEKWVQLLREAVPTLSALGAVWDSTNPPDVIYRPAIEEAGKRLRVRVQSVEAHTAEGLEQAFVRLRQERIAAVIVMPNSVNYSQRYKIVDLALSNRLPLMFAYPDAVRAGALMSYGADLLNLARRAGNYVDRILKGANPATLPVEQRTKYTFLINLKTAKALGLTIPPSLLLRADQVIE